MTKKITFFLTAILFLTSFACQATMVCPEPKTILQNLQNQGVPPTPWDWNPITGSSVVSTGDQFYKVVISGAGYLRAVSCFYINDNRIYSIWWQVTAAPLQFNPYWLELQNGYTCSESIDNCTFNVGTKPN